MFFNNIQYFWGQVFYDFNFLDVFMMKLLTAYRLRQGLAVSLLGLLFSGSYYLALPASGNHQPGWMAELEGEDEENDADRPRPDRPDLALLQDMDRTRDPATGTVPSERLLAAARYNEARLKGLAQRGTATSGLSAASWTERGPSNVGGRLLALLVDPTDATGNTVWAGAAGGGLWKATNASSASIAWTNANSSFNNLAVSALAAEPGSSPLVIYAGTGEGFFNSDAVRGAGIFKSTDGGTTWTALPVTVSNSNFWRIQKIVVHPVTKDVYVATRNGGLYRSTDKGVTWTQVLTTTTTQASTTTRVSDIEIAADNTIFVSFGIFSTDGIYRSATGDPGTWTNLNTLSGSGLPTTGYQRIEVACAPSDASRLYAAFQSSAAGTPILDLYRSLNGGTTWQVLPKPNDADAGIGADYTRGQAWYDLPLAVSPTDPNTLWVGGIDLFKTTNGGTATASSVTWQQVSQWNTSGAPGTATQNVHADQHAMAFPTGSSTKMYFGNDGGFYASTNPTVAIPTITDGNSGLNVTQFYGVAMHPTTTNYFLAGAQDNGTHKFSAAGINATTEVTGGDGGLSAIDQNAPTNQFTSYVYNNYFRSTDGGASFTSLSLSNSSGSFINPWDFDSNANVLYAGWNTNTYMAWTNALTSNANNARTNIPALPANSGDVAFVGISPLTANRIYLGMGSSFTTGVNDGGMLYRVDNASTTAPTIKTLYTGPVNTSVSCVAVDPANEQHLLVTLSNYGIVSVLETTDADAATPTWTSVEGTLPDMPVRWALFDPRGATRALLATEMGVYSTDKLNGSSTVWNPTSNGPLNMRVDMLRYRTGDKLVAAATHGRGLFTSGMFALPLPVTLTSLAASRQSPGAVVRWQTASEQHSLRFEVERSVNAVDYQRIGTVAAAGSSSSALTYSLSDATVGLGGYYYRLRQVDTDGTISYSAPVALAAAASAGNTLLSSVYPNPFRADLRVELTQPATGSVALDLVDTHGRRVWAGSVAAPGRQVQLAIPATVAPGTYVLLVRANGQQVSRRVVKE